MAELTISEERIHPARGLVLTTNRAGKPYPFIDLQRWLRLSRTAYKTDKVDIAADGRALELLPRLLEDARTLNCRLSLRCGTTPPPILTELADAGLFDVLACLPKADIESLNTWAQTCAGAGLPLRVQVDVAGMANADPDAFADACAEAKVNVVTLSIADPFAHSGACASAEGSHRTLDAAFATLQALASRGIEANLVGLPLCLAPEELRMHVQNRPQFFLDHQHYNKLAYDLAAILNRRSPVIGGKLLLILLAQHTMARNPVDSKVFPWLAFHPWVNMRIWVLRKLTRHMRVLRSAPRPMESTAQFYERVLGEDRAKQRTNASGPCAECSLRRICDRMPGETRNALPGLELTTQPGEAVLDPLHYGRKQPKHYDEVDADRAHADESREALAKRANAIINTEPPDREVDSFDYELEGQWTHQMPGGVRWFSITNSEKVSTILTRSAPPLTLSFTVGGGMADYIGFTFGRHCKIVCPMVEYRHRITLHIAEDGHFVLLRDGRPLAPVEFEGTHCVPLRLSGVLEPRLSIWNIDMELVTQTVQVWEGNKTEHARAEQVKYSVLAICTRYARRLEAALKSIAHQKDIDPALIEVVVAYVPGLDTTDDILDSMRVAYPHLRIVRSPFPDGYARSKGFMINESARLASGEWVMLLDSDTLLPPNMFAEIEKVEKDTNFVAPDGRKMLPHDVTARVLLGEIKPWECWQELLDGPGELRLREAMGVPIGFCQCVRAKCLQEIPYEELDHFEGADWRFGSEIRNRFGKEVRPEGVRVLHLDHSGSQWYGAGKQF